MGVGMFALDEMSQAGRTTEVLSSEEFPSIDSAQAHRGMNGPAQKLGREGRERWEADG